MTPAFAAALITDQHGRYLLQLRDDKPRILHPGAWGLFGGGEGGRCRTHYSEGVPAPVKGVTMLAPGQVAGVETPGAGGYGDPHERDPALVAKDLREGRISRKTAKDVYGYRE